jgi:hypothetical protein
MKYTLYQNAGTEKPTTCRPNSKTSDITVQRLSYRRFNKDSKNVMQNIVLQQTACFPLFCHGAIHIYIYGIHCCDSDVYILPVALLSDSKSHVRLCIYKYSQINTMSSTLDSSNSG